MRSLATPVVTADGPMDIHLVLPAPAKAATRGPAIVVFQEAYGVNAHILRVCERLAGAGYLAAAPELYHREGPGARFDYGDFDKVRPTLGRLSNAQLLTDLRATHDLLATRPDVDPERIAAVGFCLGGFVAALAACHLPVAAAVSFYGGGMARVRPGIGLTPLLDDFARLACPILFFFGDQDQAVPAADVAAVRARLAALGKPHEIVVYPGVGHAFFCDERPSYHAATAAAAWDRTLRWLATHLGRPSPPDSPH